MKNILLLLIPLILISQHLIANDEGRAIRSNWYCMDAALGCAGIYDHGSETEGLLSFSATIRFRPFEYNSFPDPYIQLEAGNTSVVLPISQNEIADVNNHSTELIGYDSKGGKIFDVVSDITFFFTAYIPIENDRFEYYIGLVNYGKQPYPVWNYDRLTAPFYPDNSWTSFKINKVGHIIETMVKPICANTPCAGPPTRLVASEIEDVAPQQLEMSVTPNPFNDRLNISYQLTESTEQVEFEVLDVTGKTMHRTTKNNLSKGNHQLALDSSNWTPGIYICKIQGNNERNTIKIVKQ